MHRHPPVTMPQDRPQEEPQGFPTIKVALADASPVVLDGLELRLQDSPDIDTVGFATNVEEILACHRQMSPDVILVDYELPGGGIIEVLQEIRTAIPTTRCIAFSALTDAQAVRRVFAAGGRGYLLKMDRLEDLAQIIRQVHQGGLRVSQGVSQAVLDDFLERPVDPVTLTQRQREILQLIARGKSSPEIAQRLGIRLRTVHAHRSRLMKKFEVHSATELVYKAWQSGLL